MDHAQAGHLIAGTLQAGGKAAGSATLQDAESGMLIAFGGNNTSGPIEVSTACRAHGSFHGDFESETFVTHSLTGEGFDASEYGTGRGTPLVPMAFDCKASGRNGFGVGEVSPTMRAMSHKDGNGNAGGQVAVHGRFGVRRLLPVEAEKLQGFAPGYTQVPYRGKRAADGPRYRAIGNSFAVNVVRWIGTRIQMAEQAGIKSEK